MAAASKSDLVDAFDRLRSGLDWLDQQEPDGRAKAAGIRSRLVEHMAALSDGIAGKTQRCPVHRNQLAHACAPCRSERIGRADWDLPSDQPMPPVPDEVREVDARIVGERHEEGL